MAPTCGGPCWKPGFVTTWQALSWNPTYYYFSINITLSSFYHYCHLYFILFISLGLSKFHINIANKSLYTCNQLMLYSAIVKIFNVFGSYLFDPTFNLFANIFSKTETMGDLCIMVRQSGFCVQPLYFALAFWHSDERVKDFFFSKIWLLVRFYTQYLKTL